MKKFIITLSKPALVLFLAIGSLNSYAQQADKLASEERISDKDLIKLATKAPFRENFTTEEEYAAAKEAWIKEYPDAHKRIVGESPAGGSGPGTANDPQTQKVEQLMSQYGFPTADESGSEEDYQKAKKEWVEKNPDKYDLLLKATDTP